MNDISSHPVEEKKQVIPVVEIAFLTPLAIGVMRNQGKKSGDIIFLTIFGFVLGTFYNFGALQSVRQRFCASYNSLIS